LRYPADLSPRFSLGVTSSVTSSRDYARWLWLLLALFIVRVLAQAMALLTSAPFLPPFESWHSGVLPYPALVAAQLLIIAWFARTAWRFNRGEVTPRYRLGVWMLAFGAVYFATMLVRLVLGVTVLSSNRWFSSVLPTMFHLVLAAYLLVYGHFHFRNASTAHSALPPVRQS
jgi:uncharacterized protein